jgi:hypothetical protein
MGKLLYLFTSPYFTFKYIFKMFMIISMNLGTCCLNVFSCSKSFHTHINTLFYFSQYNHQYLKCFSFRAFCMKSLVMEFVFICCNYIKLCVDFFYLHAMIVNMSSKKPSITRKYFFVFALSCNEKLTTCLW